MRKFIAIFAVAAMLTAALTACGNNNEQNPEDSSSSSSSTTPQEQENEGDNEGDSDNEGDNENEGDSEGEGEGDSEGEGDNSADEEGATQKILEAIKAAYGDDYAPNAEIPEDLLSSMYGLDPDTYTEAVGEMPLISTTVDTVIIVKAAEGKTGDVEAALNSYRDYLINESLQYPMNVAKVNATKVVANGDYVAFLLLGAYDDRDDASDSERAEFAEEQVKKGVDAFNAYFD